MQVVGFAGPARVGKTEITKALAKVARDAGWRVEVIPFAQPLKQEAYARGFGKESDPGGYRTFCQEHGAAMRAEDENYWLSRWQEMVEKQWDNCKEVDGPPLLIIADDVRYDNEHQAVRKGGGNVVFLHPGNRELDEASAPWRTHESEMLANTCIGDPDLRKELFDFTMFNDQPSDLLPVWAKGFFDMIVNFPGSPEQVCECEGCMARLENRKASVETLLQQLEELADSMERDLDDDKEDNDDEDNETT